MYLICTATACFEALYFNSGDRPLGYKPLLFISPPKTSYKRHISPRLISDKQQFTVS